MYFDPVINMAILWVSLPMLLYWTREMVRLVWRS